MEKPLYPSTHMRITQGYMMGTHVDSYAIDDAGIDTGISSLKAPFTGVIKKIYKEDANEVWLESTNPVLYPDGTTDYMTMLFVHDNNVDDLFIGKVINKGDAFYQEGTKGNATGNHCHIECGRGKFTGTGWHKNAGGYWSINNSKKPEECLWIDDSITVMNNGGYDFKRIPTEQSNIVPTSPTPNQDTNNKTDSEPQTNNTTDKPASLTPKLIFTCKKDDVYAIKLKQGQKLYLL